ncbi:hypothetical protein niasHS_004659 [Heterodera schachtii]|uniref:Peptidase S1 domain-containing protein n=2 Tax=Heterodera TaxID=34509 RepID=A0ABD2JMJ1_HETSC
MFSVGFFFMITSFLPSDATYSRQQLNNCLSKCGVIFDPLPEAQSYRSMGSIDAPEHTSPWTVLLIFTTQCPTGEKLQDRCTGFIVSHDLILTASHCVFINYNEIGSRCRYEAETQKQWLQHTPEELAIYIGYSDITNPSENAQLLQGEDINNIFIPIDFSPHQLKDGLALKFDYAVIKLAKPLIFGEYLRPICMSKSRMEEPPPQRIAQMASWGLILDEKNEPILSNKLRLLNVPIQDSEECGSRSAQKASGFNERYHLCAGSRSLGGLEGDSGSALVVDISSRSYAVGLFSMLTTNSSFRNVQADVFIRSSAMCETLRTINGGVPICKSNFQELDVACQSILRERRIQLADLACGAVVSNCQSKLAGSLGEPSKLIHTQNLGGSDDGKKRLSANADKIYKSIFRTRLVQGDGILSQVFTKNQPDTEQILNILVLSNFTTRRQIAKEFKIRFHKKLTESISVELPNEGPKELILALLYERDEYDAISLHNAIKGFGTDEYVLTSILVTRSNEQIRAIQKAYFKLFTKELQMDIVDDTSGTYRKLLSNLCAASRDETGKVNKDKAKKAAKALSGAGKLSSNESALLELLTQDNRVQMNIFFDEYERRAGISMEKALTAEFSGDSLDAFIAIVQHARNPARYFSDCLFAAIEKQKEHEVIRLVVTFSENGQMPAIGTEFQKKHGLPLASFIVTEAKMATKNTLAKLANAFVEGKNYSK